MTIDTSSWGWPQWAMAFLFFLSTLVGSAAHGLPRTGKHNGFVVLIGNGVTLFLLAAGGFFR